MTDPIRLGKICFANCDFPYYAIEYKKIDVENIEIIEQHPVKLAEMLFKKELDITPISSIMYKKDLLILPNISITSNNFTKSVLVCSDNIKNLSELDGKTLCIPETTATSSTLIKIILSLKGINTKIIKCKGTDINDMLKKGDAALLIGDSAIHAIGKYNIISDLGNEWKKLTGKKMVYAIWVVRKEFAIKYPEKVKYVLSKLLESKEYGYKHISEIANIIAKKKNIDCNFMRDYLYTLDYEFDKESIESLKLFYNLFQANNKKN